MSYLIGGGSLEGVTFDDDKHQIIHNDSNLSYFSSSLSSSTTSSLDLNSSTITLRRLGLDSDQFSHSLLELHGERSWQELDASRNQMTTIPPIIERFTALTYLNLSCNHISVIPDAMYQLTRLQYLVLSENQITVIPEEMPHFLSDLQVLHLDDNRLTELPDTIGQWRKLRELRLGSEFGGNLIQQLPPTLSSMRSLVELDVSFNQIRVLSPTTFQQLKRLRYLNLSHNQISELPQEYMFESCQQLSTLDLSDNLLTGLSLINARDITRLMTHERLELLNLSDNQLTSIPTELLDQAHSQVIIKGNPLAEYHHQESSTQASVRAQVQTGTSFSEFEPLQENTQPDEPAVVSIPPASTTAESIPAEHTSAENNTTYLVHSLRELAIRTAISAYGQEALSQLPPHVISEIQSALQICPQCQLPFIHEWVSTTQLKTYRGYPSVVRQVRFCKTQCWLDYRELVNQQALASSSNVNYPRQRALDYVAEHPQTRDSNSFDWIMAAVIASTEQEQQTDLLANVI